MPPAVRSRTGIRTWVIWLSLYAVATLFFVRLDKLPELRTSHGVLVYLLLIIGASRQGGRPLSLVMVALGYLAVDVLFVPPRFEFGTAKNLDLLILIGFLITGVVISQLFAGLQRAVRLANERSEEVTRLSDARVLLERDALPQGSTALSSGFVPAAATQAQRAQGISDSPQLFAQDIQAKAHGRAAPVLVEAYSRAIGPALDALAQHHGIPWHVLDTFLYPGHSVHRMHCVPEKTGAGLMMRLHNAAEAAGVVVLTEAQVSTLYVNGTDQVLGVGFVRPDGQVEQLSCDSVLRFSRLWVCGVDGKTDTSTLLAARKSRKPGSP